LTERLVQATVSFCKVPDLKGMKTADAQAALSAAGCSSNFTQVVFGNPEILGP
jgi:hypothetical protein